MMKHWRLSAYYFFYFAFLGGFNTYFGLYLQWLGCSAWEIGVLLSLMQVMRLVAPNLWGWLADRAGRKAPVVRLASAACALAFALFFATTSFAALFVAMALMAFFWSASLPLVEAITLGHLRAAPERYGRIRLWGSIGFIATVVGVGGSLDRMPVADLLWVLAATLVVLWGVARMIEDAPEPWAPPDEAGLGDTLRRPEVRALLAACFFMAVAHAPLYVFYSIFLVDHGYAKTVVGALWAVGVVAEIGVFLAMPRLMRQYGLQAILLASFAAAAVRFLLIGWGVDRPALLLAAQVLHGATFGAFHAAAMAALHRWFPGRHQARAQALYGSVSFGAGGMVGGLLAGQLWDPAGPGVTYSVAAAAAAIGGLLVWRGVPADRGPATSVRREAVQ